MEKIKQIIKENAIVTIIICSVFLLSFILLYFLNIRPSQIKKQCSETRKYDSYQYTNPKYNEVVEKQAREKLGEYINCRNNNITGGDQLITPLNNSYSFTQDQYESLSLEELSKLTLNKLDPRFYVFYLYNQNGYYIDNPIYENLKENKYEYSQCNFPNDFVEEEVWGGNGEYKANASDTEYKSCLRNHGLDK